MELKEARCILAIARQKSSGKAAESLFISQPSLSKYLKKLETQLGGPLFTRRDNGYLPTYLGERYLHYAEQSLKNHSIDLTIYNVHEFPKLLDFQVLRKEEIVLILAADHPLAKTARPRDGFCHPWIDMGLLADENFILLYPDQNTGGIALNLFKEYSVNPPVLLHTRNSEMSINLALDGMGAALAPESYYRHVSAGRTTSSVCLSVGHTPLVPTTIAAYQKKRYQPQHAKDYMEMIRNYCRRLSLR